MLAPDLLMQGRGGVGGHLGALAEAACLTDAQAPVLSLGLHQVTRKPQWPAPAVSRDQLAHSEVPSGQRLPSATAPTHGGPAQASK